METVGADGEKTFAQLWRELRQAGWTAKAPAKLGVDYRYVPPGGSVKGTEGHDVFTGTDALEAFARRHELYRVGANITREVVSTALAATVVEDEDEASGGDAVDSGSTRRRSRRLSARADVQSVCNEPPQEIALPSSPSNPPASTKSVDTAEPRTAEPRTAEPRTAEPDTAEPDTAELDTAESNTAEDDAAEEYSTVCEEGETSAASDVDAVFDSPGFMDAMRNEHFFDDVQDDDVNISSEPVDDSDYSDLESDKAMESLFDLDNEEDEITDDEEEDDGWQVDLSEASLCTMTESGWAVFDETMSGGFMMDAASDFYDGEHRPTQSALAFAEHPSVGTVLLLFA